MIKRWIFTVLVLLSSRAVSQETGYVNPKGQWYFGAEIGFNHFNSHSHEPSRQSLQGGLLAEYYFAKQWSLSGRVKYFETAISFHQSASGGWFGSAARHGSFEGATIALPLQLKWEFRVYRNLKANLTIGYAYLFETKSEYSNYSDNFSPDDYKTDYGNVVPGLGLTYFVNNNMAVYASVETYQGTIKGYTSSLLGNQEWYNWTMLFNFGIKHTFQSKSE